MEDEVSAVSEAGDVFYELEMPSMMDVDVLNVQEVADAFLESEYSEVLASRLEVIEARFDETLVVLGNMQGYMLFSIVVLLCFFVYRFFRMFF